MGHPSVLELFGQLGGFPTGFHLLQRCGTEIVITGKANFHSPEAAFELGIGGAKCRFGVDTEFTREVGADEQKIADLISQTLIAAAVCQFVLYFGDFLVHLVHDPFRCWPIEADARGTVL